MVIEMVLPAFDYRYTKLDRCLPNYTELYSAAEQKQGLGKGKWAPIPK